MNKNQKFLKKLNIKEGEHVAKAIESILYRESEGLDVKKLKNYTDLFRVRVGRIRIIYYKKEGMISKIIFTGFRDDNTYNNLKFLSQFFT